MLISNQYILKISPKRIEITTDGFKQRVGKLEKS